MQFEPPIFKSSTTDSDCCRTAFRSDKRFELALEWSRLLYFLLAKKILKIWDFSNRCPQQKNARFTRHTCIAQNRVWAVLILGAFWCLFHSENGSLRYIHFATPARITSVKPTTPSSIAKLLPAHVYTFELWILELCNNVVFHSPSLECNCQQQHPFLGNNKIQNAIFITMSHRHRHEFQVSRPEWVPYPKCLSYAFIF